jgi:hypothetical protein
MLAAALRDVLRITNVVLNRGRKCAQIFVTRTEPDYRLQRH